VELLHHWERQRRKVPIAHADRFRMSPSLEDDLLVLPERLINIYREPVKVPKG